MEEGKGVRKRKGEEGKEEKEKEGGGRIETKQEKSCLTLQKSSKKKMQEEWVELVS